MSRDKKIQITKDTKLDVFDVCHFFESFQGEFPDIGYHYTFVRFRKCNYKCPWCHYEDGNLTYKVFYPVNKQYLTSTSIQSPHDFVTILTHDIDTDTSDYTEILNYDDVEFNMYYEITIQLPSTTRTFKVSPDHQFARVLSIVPNFTWEWTSASLLNVGDYILGIKNSRFQVINKALQTTPITLKAIKTASSTYVYGDIIHHNCDTEDIMTYGKVNVNFNDLLNSLHRTNGILFTGGEPSIYLSFIAMIMDFIIDNYTNKGNILHRIAFESNGTNLKKLVEILDVYKDRIIQKQNQNIKAIYVWSPKFYDNMSANISFKTLEKDIVKHPDVYIKLVYEKQTENILRSFIDKAVEIHGDEIRHKIAIMPEGDDSTKLLNKEYVKPCIVFAKNMKINFSTRLHILYDIV